MTMSNSIQTRQHKLGQFKQAAAAAAPRVVARSSRRQQPITQAILTTIPRVSERSGDSSDSGRSAGSLRVMSLISSLVDIEVSALYGPNSNKTGKQLRMPPCSCVAVTPNAFPPLKVSRPHSLHPHGVVSTTRPHFAGYHT